MPTLDELKTDLAAAEAKLFECQAARDSTIEKFGNDGGWGVAVIAAGDRVKTLEAQIRACPKPRPTPPLTALPFDVPLGVHTSEHPEYAIIHETVQDAWEILNEQSLETLKENPDDEEAQRNVMQFNLIKKGVKPITVIKKKRNSGRGFWDLTRFGYCVRVHRAKTGQCVPVRMRDGSEQNVVLGEEVTPNLYKPARQYSVPRTMEEM